MLQAQATDDNKKFYYTQAHPFDLMAVGMLQAFNVRHHEGSWGRGESGISRLGIPRLLFELLIV